MPQATAKKKPRRKTTVTGRVVYDREKHQFKDKDAIRIVKHLLLHEPRWGLDHLIFRLFSMIWETIVEVLKERKYNLTEWLIMVGIPQALAVIITIAIKYLENAWEVLQACWNVAFRPIARERTIKKEGKE